MMRVPIILFLLITQISFGQSGKVKLFEFRNSTCRQESDPRGLRTRIIKKELNKNVLTVEIASVATCCVNFIPKVTFKDRILNLDLEETGEFCECTCCYEFVFQVKGISEEDVKINFRGKDIVYSGEKYLTYPIKYKLMNGDTINYVDKYGLRQGKWNTKEDTSMTKVHYEYIDDMMVRAVKYYPNGMIASELIRSKVKFIYDNKEHNEYSDYNQYIEYYETGSKMMECYNVENTFNNSYKIGKCKEWNENGELIYEGHFRK